MANNNKNPRRTIWLSETEPLSHYDIWLSKNQHFNSEGESISDSKVQRPCDYIFKVWDCDKWHPIVGFNSTATNKINTVASADGYSQDHLPLFGDPNNSPDELVDGGTVSDVLKNHISESEWKEIIENGGLGVAINTFIQEGDIDIGVDFATKSTCGGILSDRHPNVENLKEAGVLVRFTPENLNLHDRTYGITIPANNLSITGRLLIDAINYEQENHPTEPGINPGSNITIDSNILYRSFYHSASIKRDFEQGQTSANKPKFSIWGVNNTINAGKFLKLRDDLEKWTLNHGNRDYDNDNNALEWVDLKDWFDENYELNLASTTNLGGIMAAKHQMFTVPHLIECKLGSNNYFSQGNEYKRNALHVSVQDIVKNLDNWYASNESSIWDLIIQSNYGINTMKHTSVDDDGVSHIAYAHTLDHYNLSTKDGLYPRTKTYSNPVPGLYNGTKGLEWVPAYNIVEEGLGISSGTGYLYYNGSIFSLASVPGGGGTSYDVLGTNNYATAGNYVVGVSNGGTGGANKYLNGLGQWTTPPDTNTTYNDFSGSTHGLVPASTSASQDKYLKGDGTWGTPSVATGFNITMVASYMDDADFTLNGNRLTSNSLNPVNARLSEWCYYNVDGGNNTTTFTFMNTISSGNAIYIRFNTGGASVLLRYDKNLILSNISNSGRFVLEENSSYLFTILFGIIKIEKIQTQVF